MSATRTRRFAPEVRSCVAAVSGTREASAPPAATAEFLMNARRPGLMGPPEWVTIARLAGAVTYGLTPGPPAAEAIDRVGKPAPIAKSRLIPEGSDLARRLA